MQINMKIPHISFGTNADGYLYVTVEDTELFDYVDDYLTEECRIEYSNVTSSENNNVSIYTMIFPKETNVYVLSKVIKDLSISEIERIYKINNPK